MIAIISGIGANIASIQYALQRLGVESTLTQDKQLIRKASHVLLPGVGTAAYAMQQLQQADLVDTLKSLTQPTLGICLGMQLLFSHSSEGDVDCLDIIPGTIQALQPQIDKPLPHMGWNRLNILRIDPILQDLDPQQHQYFVHSFRAGISSHTLASCQYGETFSAIVKIDNYYGIQCHPEKSGRTGEKILQNFLNL